MVYQKEGKSGTRFEDASTSLFSQPLLCKLAEGWEAIEVHAAAGESERGDAASENLAPNKGAAPPLAPCLCSTQVDLLTHGLLYI